MTRQPLLLLGLLLLAAARAAAQQPAANPHGELDLPCATCHTAEGWTVVKPGPGFDHAKEGFALSGAHARVSCKGCHQSLDFKGTRDDCAACHRDAHQGELGPDCARCHTSRSFLDRASMLRMHQLTRFPLQGSHRTVDCESCHAPAASGRPAFAGKPTACVECHLQNYQRTRDPDHQAGGFNLDCSECHTAVSWSPARFDHNATKFPLTGAHRALACKDCHGDKIGSGVPINCVGCHQKDYDGTANPAHQPAGFPTTCSACHSTSTWAGARFDHDGPFFPIYSGRHRGVWSSCADCHNDPKNYANFTCLTCHTKAETDPHHREVGGYSYDSQACYSCHRTGRSGN